MDYNPGVKFGEVLLITLPTGTHMIVKQCKDFPRGTAL